MEKDLLYNITIASHTSTKLIKAASADLGGCILSAEQEVATT